MKRTAVLMLTVAMLCGGAAEARSGSPGAASAHPRLWLDAATLKTLRARAKKPTAEWKALQKRCDAFVKGHVEYPDGEDYPDSNSIGEGYQGDGYFPALMDVGLCYQVALKVAPTKAKRYGAKGADVLDKMSTLEGPHAADPSRDSVYGVRFYGLGLAMGYDWLYPALSSQLRGRVRRALHAWLDTYEREGFERDFPQGNYFAGYYAAKSAAALALEGDDSEAPAMWTDWLERIHRGMVQPYYAANLSGGGWPEGWNYGPEGTINMQWPVLAAETAKGLDLLRGERPYAFALNAPKFLLWFTWPNMQTMEDSNFLYDSDNPSPTHPWLVTIEAGLLQHWHDAFAPYFHAYARAIRKLQPGGEFGPDWDLWVNFLFWDDKAPEKDYKTLPLSYYAPGIEMAAVRSSWERDAVWAEFTGGPYVNYTENGEELFGKGSLAIMNGARQFLVNAFGAFVRNTPGTEDGSRFYDLSAADVFDDNSPRDLFNIFYVGEPAPNGQGTYLRQAGARTTMSRFEDRGTYVVMRSSFLEDQYPRDEGLEKPISSWTRDVVYIRPDVFVVHDRTEVTDPSLDQRLAWHFLGQPVDLGDGRFRLPAGTVQAVLPAGHSDRVVDVFGGHKVFRLEVRPGAAATGHDWITVFEAGSRGLVASPVEVAGGVGVRVGSTTITFGNDGSVGVAAAT